jgi:hypothetical protein
MTWYEPSDESEWAGSSAHTFTSDDGIWVLFPISLEIGVWISKYRIKLPESCASDEIKIALYDVSAASFYPTTLIHGGTAQSALSGLIEETMVDSVFVSPDDLDDPSWPRLWIGLRASGGASCADSALSYSSGGSTPLPWGFPARRIGLTGSNTPFADDWPEDITGDSDSNLSMGYAAVWGTLEIDWGGGLGPCANYVSLYYGIEVPTPRGELGICGVNPGGMAVSADGIAMIGSTPTNPLDFPSFAVIYLSSPYGESDIVDMTGIIDPNQGVSSIKII